ncbi:putative ferredoxin--NADP(+) reductase [Gordonia araii NBRC 100433]|uniref:ferredoxin--NADP(+) reductase n=1 Tax=Gordonia araii NBRC 100433 TaxID=1073574 RepID=G7H5Y3_9ACTN|nr:4Fe-4S binding protein [Gordonia araii]NNG98742.1 4Fe-4S binding protein [Gordonia araii NBRC 100433]GAB11258.1 putative ferredoxin--NADP(+) reductase [Gordonia araii NBRC 100433]
MPHVVTQACCGDASCVYACPVNCIHPTPDEPDFGTAEMLYIDPSTCVDCGACVTACPVGAIVPGHRLTAEQQRFADLNAAQFDVGLFASDARFPVDMAKRLPLAPVSTPEPLRAGPQHVAIVGSGPSAMYAADELLRLPNVTVTMYERLSAPFGLVRYGVAPDHTATRTVMRLFDQIAGHDRLRILLNCEIGRDITLDELRARHDAIIWAGGAPTDRPLNVPGNDAEGFASATSLVGWYNDHPDFADEQFDLSGPRVVIIGNGNVALDVARILTSDPAQLEATTISRTALDSLRHSGIREVLVVGRRGPLQAAFTLPELVGLADHGEGTANIVVDPAEIDALATEPTDVTEQEKLALLRELAQRQRGDGPVIRFAFGLAPTEILTDDGVVTGVRFARNTVAADGSATPTGEMVDVDAGLVLSSIGYHGVAVPGLPFDEKRGVIPNDGGRVMDGDVPVSGMYVTGWIKRGPSGFIGTNKTDSAQTVASWRADVEAGVLAR